MKKIQIFDTTLRDGEQAPGCSMSIEEKIKIAQKLEELNVDIIEAGFAASSNRDLKAIQEISKKVKKPIITSLSRLVRRDIDLAKESLKYAKKKRIHLFIATSDIHMKYKLKMTKEEIINKIKELIPYAKNYFDDIEFSLEDATRTDYSFMIEVIKEAINAGATVINIPDTVGYITPEEYITLIKKIKRDVPNIDLVTLSCHCHDDLGLSTSNALSGIKAGITQVECTINGIGERAGNTALEEIVAILKTRGDLFDAYTDINTKRIYETSKLVEKITNNLIQNNKAIVGENAFKHESGIHQHGVLNNSLTYEIINAEDFGINTEHCIIGIHSGKHAIIKKMEEMNYNVEKYNIDIIIEEIKKYFAINNKIDDEIFNEIVNKSKKGKQYKK